MIRSGGRFISLIFCNELCSDAANDRVHAFFESEHFNNGILPIPGAYETLLQLASYCRLVVVT